MTHTNHQMQVTSFYNSPLNAEELDKKFRQKVKRQIIELLQKHQNLTDREMAAMLGFNDPNKVRPRRNELSSMEKTKHGVFVRDAILIEAEKRSCNVSGKLSIAWKISQENLNAYLKS